MAETAKTPLKRRTSKAAPQPETVSVQDVAVAAPTVEASAQSVSVDEIAATSPAAQEGIVTMTEETVKAAATDYAEKATEMFQDATAKAKEAFAKSGEFSKEAVEFQKANLEAVVESGKIAAKGVQEAAQHAVEQGKKNWDATTAHFKALAGLRSPADFMKAQSDFVRGQFDSAVADFSKSTEFYTKLAGEIAKPIQNRYAAASEQVKARFAA